MTVAPSSSGPRAEVESLRQRIDASLRELAPDSEPERLYEPVRYVLQNGGKRLRPILLMIAARLFDADDDDVLPAALAVEVFHTFTLVHDDIMDHADERRGLATVHVKWDQSTAILCGDYLMGLSFDLLARSATGYSTPLVARFQSMVARLCEGQALDKAFEERTHVSVADYLDMVDRKTGALIQAALELGAMLGGASDEHTACLRRIGFGLGRAFQIQDDLLDLTADDERWGKAVGGDLIEGKRTYILLRAIERAADEDRRWLERIIAEDGLSPNLLVDARERIRRSGVLDEARTEVLRYTGDAIGATRSLPDSPAAETLRWLLVRMRDRMH